MRFEIINRVLEELNLEEYKAGLIAECMDDEVMGAIVDKDDASFHRTIRKIIPTLGHAIKIRKKFKKLFLRNQRERSESRSQNEGKDSSADSGSSRTDSLLSVTMANQEKKKTPASAKSPAEGSAASGSSTEPNDGHHRNQNGKAKPPIPEVVGPNNSENSGSSEFQSFQVPKSKIVRQRKKLPSVLKKPASTHQESKNQVIKAKLNETPRFNGV